MEEAQIKAIEKDLDKLLLFGKVKGYLVLGLFTVSIAAYFLLIFQGIEFIQNTLLR